MSGEGARCVITAATAREQVERYHRHVASEREAAALYRGLAEISRGQRRAAFSELAEIEERHAAFWVGPLSAHGDGEEIELLPADELRELELVYQGKGAVEQPAARLAQQVMAQSDTALDTMAGEELGLDPDDLGSPWRAAASSFTAFALGAVLVVVPYMFVGGRAALTIGVTIALFALVAVGIGMARLNGRPLGRVVARQVTVGVLAAGATFLLGNLLGLNLG